MDAVLWKNGFKSHVVYIGENTRTTSGIVCIDLGDMVGNPEVLSLGLEINFSLFCFVLYCYAFVQYCEVKTIQYIAMHKFVGVLDNPHPLRL